MNSNTHCMERNGDSEKLYSISELVDSANLIVKYDELSKKYDDLKKGIISELKIKEIEVAQSVFDLLLTYDRRQFSNWHQGSYNGYIVGYRSLKMNYDKYIDIAERRCENYESKELKHLCASIGRLVHNHHEQILKIDNLIAERDILLHTRDLRVEELESKVKELESRTPVEITKIEYMLENDLITRESPEYREFVKEVLIRDKNTCQCCGSKEHLHVHHIYPFNQHNSLAATVSNGIVLCESCHRQYHHEYGKKELCNPESLSVFLKKGYYNDIYVERLENKILALKEEIKELKGDQLQKESEILINEENDELIQEYDKLYANSSPFNSLLCGAFEGDDF